MSRTTEPSPAAGESASDRDDTTVDPTPPGGIARVDDADVEAAGQTDHNFRVLDARRSIDQIQDELRKQVTGFLEQSETVRV